MIVVEFSVEGDPATKGSWCGVKTRTGGVHMKADNDREKGWAMLVAMSARQAMALARAELVEKTQPLRVELDFRIERPRRSKYAFPPLGDVDKLERSVLDAMSKVVYTDDSQVVQTVSEKHWDDVGSVFIRVVKVAELAGENGHPTWSAT